MCSKTYDSQAGERHAEECWKKNVDEIQRLNSASKYANYVENCWSDRCPEDRPNVLRPVSAGPNFGQCQVMADGDESQYIDWTEQGAVTPVKNQGQTETCWSFSTTGIIESALLQKWNMNVSLSEMELISCAHGDPPSCQNGGWPKMALDWIINDNSGGLAAERNYPFQCPAQACDTAELRESAYSPLAVTNLTSYGATSKKQLLFALQNYGPIGVTVWSSSNAFKHYDGGFVLTADACTESGGYDHAVLLVGYGYDSEQQLSYWKIKNSWGTDQGEHGFWRIAYDDGACGISSPNQPGTGNDGCTWAPQLSGASNVTTPAPTTTTTPGHDCAAVQPGAGQRMLWVPGCIGAGCLANGKDQDCAWCVYDMGKCEAHYGGACEDVQKAREQQGASCSIEVVSV